MFFKKYSNVFKNTPMFYKIIQILLKKDFMHTLFKALWIKVKTHVYACYNAIAKLLGINIKK